MAEVEEGGGAGAGPTPGAIAPLAPAPQAACVEGASLPSSGRRKSPGGRDAGPLAGLASEIARNARCRCSSSRTGADKPGSRTAGLSQTQRFGDARHVSSGPAFTASQLRKTNSPRVKAFLLPGDSLCSEISNSRSREMSRDGIFRTVQRLIRLLTSSLPLQSSCAASPASLVVACGSSPR